MTLLENEATADTFGHLGSSQVLEVCILKELQNGNRASVLPLEHKSFV